MAKKRCMHLVGIITLIIITANIFSAAAFYCSAISSKSAANIAAFAFDAVVQPVTDLTVNAVCAGEVKIGTLQVTNQENGRICEVTTGYAIYLKPATQLPSGTSLELRNSETVIKATEQTQSGYLYKSDDFLFEPDKADSKSYDVYLCWNTGFISTTTLLVTASVIGEQID